jgi:autotransporter-associated beta strand protein
MVAIRVFTLCGGLYCVHLWANEYLDWNANGAGGGSGSWDTTSSLWQLDGTINSQAWNSSDADTYALFGGTSGGTVTMESGVVVNSLVFNTDGYVLNADGAAALTLKNNSASFGANIVVSNPGQTATINAPIAGTGLYWFQLYGPGTLVLGGANTFTATSQGITIAGNGTIKLAGTTGSLVSSNNLVFNGGTGSFIYDNTGATAAIAQSLGNLDPWTGDATVENNRVAAQKVMLTFAFEGRSQGATVNFIANGGTNGIDNIITFTGQSGFINQGSFFQGSNYAWEDSAGFVRGINYGSDSGSATTAGGTKMPTGISYVQITGPITGQTTATVTTLNISGANNFTLASSSNVALTVNGILKSGNNAATISGSGTNPSIKPASNQDLVIRTDQASDSLTISVPITIASTTQALTKSGAGTLTLTGSTSGISGPTYIDGGVLSLATFPAGAINIEGGTLLFTGTSGSSFTKALNAGFGGGTIEVDTGTTLNLSGQCQGANQGNAFDALIKTGGGTLVLNGSSDNSGFCVAVNAGILQLKQSGAGHHSVSGLIINNGGTVQITGTNGDEIYDGSFVVVNTGGTLDFKGEKESFDGLSGGGTLTNSGTSSSSTAASTVTLGAGGDTTPSYMNTFTGNIADGTGKISLVKTGAGTQTLAGASTYSGGTTISSGTLLVNNTTGSATGTGAVTVQSGTIGGTGSVSGLLTIDSGATLAPGASNFGAGGVNLMSGAQMVFTLGADRVTDSGGLTLGNTINLTLSGFSLGTYDLIDFSGTLTNNSSNFSGWTVTGLTTGYTATFKLTSSALQVQVVPEPTSGLLLALGVVGMGGRRSRRRSKS